MKVFKIKDMVRGWFIGDFEPSILKTKEFEVGVLSHSKGENWPAHYHKDVVEYNLLLEGKMIVQDTEINVGDLFVFDKGEVSDPKFIEDCKVLVVKTPSLPGDKYEVF